MRTFDGGSNDLVRWKLEVNEYLSEVRTFNRDRVTTLQVSPPDADLTLYGLNRAECEAVIALINGLRASGYTQPSAQVAEPSIGDRFSGLDLEGVS